MNLSSMSFLVGKRFRFLASVVVVAVLMVISTSAPASALVSYMVKSGDSLYRIGQKYGLTSQQLQRVNNLSSTLIYPGQIIKIPTIYQVNRGDSWYLIAQKFGVSVNQLKYVNNRWNDLIYPGEKLLIPVVTSKTVASTATPSRGLNGYSREDIILLAKLIRAEAGGEPYIGQVAVGAVVLNRVRDSGFPNTISGVIFQRLAFSCVHEGTIWQNPLPTNINAANDALKGWDPTEGALYFYNPDKPCAAWIFTRQVIKRIGNHVFAK